MSNPKKVPKAKKSRAKKTRTEAEYQELRKAVVALTRCAMSTLGSGGKIGMGSGMVIDTKTHEVRHWTTQYFDALDLVGVEYDREAYLKSLKRRRR